MRILVGVTGASHTPSDARLGDRRTQLSENGQRRWYLISLSPEEALQTHPSVTLLVSHVARSTSCCRAVVINRFSNVKNAAEVTQMPLCMLALPARGRTNPRTGRTCCTCCQCTSALSQNMGGASLQKPLTLKGIDTPL